MQFCKFFFSTVTVSLFAALCVAGQTASLNTIKGTVIDAQSGAGVEGINVYLANTTIGTSTDSNGAYELNTTTTGDFNLVFSIVGYQRKIFTVQLKKGTNIHHNVQLAPQVIQMQEVEVVSSNKTWKRDYEFFIKEFIGETDFAEQTTIQNPWVLDFKDGEGNQIIATSQEPIVIENKALGYKLYLELVEFVWNRNGHGGAYQVYPRYEELDADNDLQKQIWQINRWKTYFGSLPHFLGSLYHNRLEKEHFNISRLRNITSLSEGETKFELLGKTGISSHRREQLKGYKIDRATEVSFEHTLQIKLENSTLKVPIKKESKISANTRNELFFIDKNGILLHPTSLKMYGVWAKNRVANSLPTNYVPDS